MKKEKVEFILFVLQLSNKICKYHQFSSVSHVQLFAIPWTAACQASLSITNSWLAQTRVHQVGDAIQPPILCHPRLLLPSLFPSIRVFSIESVLSIRWPKNWSFSFSISLSNEYSGMISYRIYWFDLLAVQGVQRVNGWFDLLSVQVNTISFKIQKNRGNFLVRQDSYKISIHLRKECQEFKNQTFRLSSLLSTCPLHVNTCVGQS